MIKEQLENDGFHIEKNDSKELVVIFGGINQGIGIPVFEFFNILNEKKTDKVFVRDFNQMWYLKGVDSKIKSFEKLNSELTSLISEYEKVSFIGNSMGGYAAILFGVLLNVDQVVVFSPQSFINSFNRLRFFDTRWRKQIKKVHKQKSHSEYFDLKKFMQSQSNYKTKINLHFCSSNRLDRIHSVRLKDFKNITLKNYPNGGHGLVKELKITGELKIILNQL